MAENLLTPSAPLSHTAAALAATGSVDVLVLGSGSTVGDSGGSGSPDLSYQTPMDSFPYRMILALRSLHPKLRFALTVQGARGMTADQMLTILSRELQSHHYDLVLWQTGTVEAVQGVRPETLDGILRDGADAVARAQADLMLIDPQYSRFLEANADLGPYEAALRQIAGTADVTLFPRFALTRTWVDAGQVDLERASHDQRDATIARLNDCLGLALARFVLAGAAEH